MVQSPDDEVLNAKLIELLTAQSTASDSSVTTSDVDINTLEQELNLIEALLNQLEDQVVFKSPTAAATTDGEVSYL